MSYEAKMALMNVEKNGMEYYQELQQNILNENFMNSSNVYLIKAENRTTNTFDDMYVRITESKSRLFASSYNNEQYRKLSFKDLSYSSFMGQIFKIEDHDWITIDTTPISAGVFSNCIVERSNIPLKFMNGNKICSYPAIVKNQTLRTLGVSVGTLKEGDSKFSIVLPYNDDTKIIKNDMRFVIGGEKGLIVTNVDKYTQEGLINLVCGECAINSTTDDIINSVADRFISQNKYEIQLSPEILNLNVGDTQQLTTTVLENRIEMTNPTIIYISSDNSLANVNSTGLVTAIAEGSVNIIATYVDNLGNNYNATYNVNISVPTIPDLFTTNMTYDGTVGFTVRKYQTGIYRSRLFNNEVEVPATWIYTVGNYTGSASTSTVNVVENTDSYIKIKNVNCTSGSVTITGTQVGGTNTCSQVINFTS